MSAVLLDGKALSARMRERLRQKAAALPRQPGLAVILVGDDPASAVYVRNKEKDCAQCGVRCLNHHLPAEATQQELLALVEEMNRREDVDGILVQLPLPEGLDSRAVLEAIRPEKDVDAFHPVNVGRLMLGRPRFLPCTPPGSWPCCGRMASPPPGNTVWWWAAATSWESPWPCCFWRRMPPSPSATAARRIWRSSAAGRTSSSPPWVAVASSPPTWSNPAPWSWMWL